MGKYDDFERKLRQTLERLDDAPTKEAIRQPDWQSAQRTSQSEQLDLMQTTLLERSTPDSSSYRSSTARSHLDRSHPDRSSLSAGAIAPAEAIGALQQRSHSEAASQRNDSAFVTDLSDYKRGLIEQEIQRLQQKADEINQRSSQQAAAILDLKRAAQQAAVGFGRQKIRHPQIEVIDRFLDGYATSHVPIIERDRHGYFRLSDRPINLRRAEEEAVENAAILRGDRLSERKSFVQPFSQPLEGPLHGTSERTAAVTARNVTARSAASNRVSIHTGFRKRIRTKRLDLAKLQTKLVKILNEISRLLKGRIQAASGRMSSGTKNERGLGQDTVLSARFGQQPLPIDANRYSDGSAFATEQDAGGYPGQSEPGFSWVDGTIWFSAAAIARIALEAIVGLVPVLQPVLGLAPLVLFGSALYLLFVAKSSNTNLMYCIALSGLGLFLGNPF